MRVELQELSPIFRKARLTECPPTVPIHIMLGPDNGPAHDHPLDFNITILHGGYIEHRYNPDGSYEEFVRKPGDNFVTEARCIHRIVHMIEGFAITAVEEGPLCNTWSFFEWRDGVMWHKPHNEPDWKEGAPA